MQLKYTGIYSPSLTRFGNTELTLLQIATAYLAGNAPYHYIDFEQNRALWNSQDVGTFQQVTGYAVSRSTAAFYPNADGSLTSFAANQARIGSRGLLVEPQTSNMLARSQDFNNTSFWTASNLSSTSPIVTPNVAVAPDGTTTADLIQFGPVASAGAASFMTQSVTLIAGNRATSIYVKAASGADVGKTFYVYQYNGTSAVNLASHVLTTNWTRVLCPVTTSVTNPSIIFGNVGSSFGGANQEGFSAHVWGAQLETLSVHTTYVTTANGSLTRPADAISTADDGLTVPMSLWAEYERLHTLGYNSEVVLQVDSGGNVTRFNIGHRNDNLATGEAYVGGIIQGQFNAGSALPINTPVKIAGRFAANNLIMASRGTLGTPDTVASINFTPTNVRFGASQGATSAAAVLIKKIAVFSSALTNEALQAITN